MVLEIFYLQSITKFVLHFFVHVLPMQFKHQPGMNERTKVNFSSRPDFLEIIFLPGQPYHKIPFLSFLSIFSSKVLNLAYNSILDPIFISKVISPLYVSDQFPSFGSPLVPTQLIFLE